MSPTPWPQIRARRGCGERHRAAWVRPSPPPRPAAARAPSRHRNRPPHHHHHHHHHHFFRVTWVDPRRGQPRRPLAVRVRYQLQVHGCHVRRAPRGGGGGPCTNRVWQRHRGLIHVPREHPIRLTHRGQRKRDVCRSHGLCRGQRGGSRTTVGGGGSGGDSIFES